MDGVTTVTIGGQPVGLIGVEEAIAAAKARQFTDDEEVKRFLLAAIKAENYVPPQREADYAQALFRLYQKALGVAVAEEESKGLVIRVLGPGCALCERMTADILAILAELGIAADFQHVRDLKEIARFGPIPTPALVINGQVMAAGRAPSRLQLKAMIQQVAGKSG
ncbi:MAG: thioredoxin family protein [candidate division KSB1 bacterium]|nr:thioredoxin family protein [candidate division KSB1 bacterium]